MNNGEIWPVCIIYYIQNELPRRCSEMNNGEVRPVCITYYIQTELPRRCSEMNNGEVRSRLYYILYMERVTALLFVNEQRQRRGEVSLY